MSRPIASAGMASASTVVTSVSAENSLTAHDVDRQDDLDARLLGARQVALARLQALGVEQALADLVALGREEGEDHPAADEEPVGRTHEVVDDRELVGDLRAAEDDGIRPLGVLREALEDVDLGGHEAAHGGREARRDVVDRRLLAVDDAEAVGDVRVGQPGEGVGELGALLVGLGGLARVEPEVLEQHDVAVGHGVDRRPGALPHGVGGEGDGAPEELAEPVDDRRERVLLLGGALGPAEVGAHDDACARLGRAGRSSGPRPGCGRRP